MLCLSDSDRSRLPLSAPAEQPKAPKLVVRSGSAAGSGAAVTLMLMSSSVRIGELR